MTFTFNFLPESCNCKQFSFLKINLKLILISVKDWAHCFLIGFRVSWDNYISVSFCPGFIHFYTLLITKNYVKNISAYNLQFCV